MQIAIIGAGLSGLATAWHLLQHSEIKVTLFDPLGIGGGASGIAAGLLHPYAGLHAKLNWRGQEGMVATGKLLNVASDALGMPVAKSSGLIRPAITEEQKKDYQKCASNYPHEVFWEESISYPGIISYPNIFIKSAVTVDCNLYLNGLWLACQQKGATLEKVKVDQLEDLKKFQAIVIAIGASTKTFKESSDLPITQVKGQILEFAWPKDLPSLPIPFNSQAYLICDPLKHTGLVGSTFERNFAHEKPDPIKAFQELSPKLLPFFPALNPNHIIDCRAGIRASTPDHLPLLKKISPKCWVLSGMGSKGLLYHAMMGESLSKLLLSESF